MELPSANTHEIGVSIDDYVFQRVPDYRRAVLVGVRTHDPDRDAIEQGLRQANRRWCSDAGPTVALEAVQRWRKAYRRVGLNPTRARPAVEALIRRARSGEVPSFGDACVDVGAIVTLTHVLPVGMHAIDHIHDDLTLAPADGEETFATFSGEVEHPEPGEIVWRAGSLVLTRRWVHKQGTAGSVTGSSTIFAVNLDVIADDDLDGAVGSMTDWLDAAGVSVRSVAVLDRLSPAERIAA